MFGTAWRMSMALPGRADRRRMSRACVGMVAYLCANAALALDLRQAYEAAVERDANIRASRAGAQAERERLPQAQAQRLPNVSFNAGRNYNDLTATTNTILGNSVSQHHNYYSSNVGLSVRQPIYRPYISALVDQAEGQVESANASLEKDEQSLVVRVGEAYFDALLARDQLRLIAAQKTNYETQVMAARKSFAGGTGTRTDIDEAQSRLDMTRAQELEVLQNVDFTRRRLEAMVAIPLGNLATLDIQRFRAEPPAPTSMDEWQTMAEAASPELRALRAQIEVARAEIDKAKAGHKPTLDAVAQWSRTNSDSVTAINTRYDQKLIGLQLSVPLYSGGYVSSQVRQAVASHERAREGLEATRLDLGVRVHKEFRGMTEGVARIAALEQAVRSAEAALTSSRMSQAAGVRTTLDVLNAEQQLTLTRRDLAQARYLYLLSRLRLQSLAGMDRLVSIGQANTALTTPSP